MVYPSGARAGWNVNRHYIKAKIEIFPKSAFPILYFQVAIGGGNHAHVHFYLLIAAHRPNSFSCNTRNSWPAFPAAVPRSHREKSCPAGGLKQAGLGAQRAGEGAFLIAKQLTFDERGHQRSAIHGDKRPVGERAAKMNSPRDNSLPVPLSPVMSTGVRVSFRREIMRSTS